MRAGSPTCGVPSGTWPCNATRHLQPKWDLEWDLGFCDYPVPRRRDRHDRRARQISSSRRSALSASSQSRSSRMVLSVCPVSSRRPWPSSCAYSPKCVEKLFGNSEWVLNRGSESGQEGSKESRSAASWRQRRAVETPSAIFQTVSRSHLINTVQVMQEAAVAHTESAPKRRETATYSGSQCAEYSSETIYEIGSRETVWKHRRGSISWSHEPAERDERPPFRRFALPRNARCDPSSYFPDSLSRRLFLRSLMRLDAPVAGEDHVSMYVILWRFRPVVGQKSEFERAYGPSGEWAQLFRRDNGYLGTELLRRFEDDESKEYLTLDRWASRVAYEAFRARWSGEYRQLDRRLEELTEEETFLGAFEMLP